MAGACISPIRRIDTGSATPPAKERRRQRGSLLPHGKEAVHTSWPRRSFSHPSALGPAPPGLAWVIGLLSSVFTSSNSRVMRTQFDRDVEV